MYRLYLVCIMSAVVLGNSDEAKYIDLLPEEEKQEFLNRIARRIIDEMQSKDSPEQSQTEVSDDQLNAHDAYVKDLIKEESANLRSERRDNSKAHLERQAFNADMRNDKVTERSNHEDGENSQHIDLTLRNNVQDEKNIINETTFNVIPVKVLYDEDEIKITQSTHHPVLVDEDISNNSQQKNNIHTENSDFNISNIKSGNMPNVATFSTERGTVNESYTKNTYKNSNSYEGQFEPKTEIYTQKISTVNHIINHSLVENSTEAQFNKKTTLVSSYNKSTANIDDSFENTENSTKINNYSNKDAVTNNNSPTENNVQLSNGIATLVPLTTDSIIQSDLKESESEVPSTAIVYVTTDKSEVEHSIKNSELDNGLNQGHNDEDTIEIKTQTNVKINVSKEHLRQGLEILSDENKFVKEDSFAEMNKPKELTRHRKPYFVYEVQEEKPIYVQVDESKQDEQPYVAPIYNYAPENAFYNAYNQFGANYDEEAKSINETTIHDTEGVLDKELYLRSGFQIDLNSKKRNDPQDTKAQYKYPNPHSRHPHWVHIIDSNLEYNPNIMGYRANKDLSQNGKRANNLIQLNWHHDKKNNYSIPRKIPNKIKYIPLRYRIDNDNDEENFRLRHKQLNHVGHKKIIDQAKKNQHQNPNPTSIELDYYFGKYKTNNRKDTVDFDDEYPEIDDVSKTDIDYIRHRKFDEINMYHKPKDFGNNFDKHLKSLLKVLKDMIYRDNKDLVSYDWLLSTVDIKSAVNKLLDLTDNIEKRNYIHPLDLKLLNYVVYLYNTANVSENTIQSNNESKALQDINNIVERFLMLLRRRIALPRNKNRRPGVKMWRPFRLWYTYNVRYGLKNSGLTLVSNPKVLRSFKIFLKDLDNNMFDLHNALKHISSITTYSNQNWYEDLKNIYLKNASSKQLMQVLLHLASAKLFSSIEETAQNVEEDEMYTDNNGEVLRRIRNEFVFVLKILKRIK